MENSTFRAVGSSKMNSQNDLTAALSKAQAVVARMNELDRERIELAYKSAVYALACCRTLGGESRTDLSERDVQSLKECRDQLGSHLKALEDAAEKSARHFGVFAGN